MALGRNLGTLLRRIFGNVPMRIVIGFFALAAVLDSLAPASNARAASPADTWSSSLSTLTCLAALFATYALVVVLLEGRRPAELRIRAALPHLLGGLAIGVVATTSHWVLAFSRPSLEAEAPRQFAGYLLAAAVAAVSEELICRGILLRVSAEWLGTIGGLLFSALFFSFLHPPEVRGDTLIAGLALGACFILTRTLWLPIGGHFAHNALLDIASGGRSREVEAATGWNVLLVGMPSILITIVLLVLAHRKQRLEKPAWLKVSPAIRASA